MDILVAIDEIDDLVHSAKRRLLHPSQVRVEGEAFASAVARMRAAIAVNMPDVVAPRVAESIGRLERMGADGATKDGRLTLDAEAVYDELDLARMTAIDDIKRQRGP
jgi:hypothetical protein